MGVSPVSKGRGMLKAAAAVLALALLASCAGSKGPSGEVDIGDSVTHRVKAGETWASIAEEYFGDREKASSIASYNGLGLDRPPAAGAGIRIPMSAADRRRFDRMLAATRHYNEGLGLASTGKYSQAAAEFEKALDIDPSMSDAAYNLGVTWQKMGMDQKAAEVIGRIDLEAEGRPEYYYALGASLFHLRRYDEAEEAFAEALELDPDHLKALYSLSVVYEKEGRSVKAAETLRRYIEKAPPGEWREEAAARLRRLTR